MKQSFLLLMIVFFVHSVYAQKIIYKEPQDIFKLDLQQKVATEKCGKFKDIKLSVNKENIERLKKFQYDIFKIEGIKATGQAGYPTTYMATQKIELEKGAEVCGIELISGKFVEIENAINLAPRAESQRWQDKKKKSGLVANTEVYGKDQLFPGKSNSYIAGTDNNSTNVFFKFYPIQYNPKRQKAYVLTNAEFRIHYNIGQNQGINAISPIKTNAENIIITSSSLSTAAASLKGLHEAHEGVSTEVITTEWIESNYSEASDPTTAGYATISNNPINNNYNYSLAKKITAYLLDDDTHPNLQSITILGDAEIVPPSYYFFIDHYDSYNNWMCSDLFYSSPDYDFVLNYELGRIPAQDATEASYIIDKISNWKNNLSESWFRNARLVGGIPFGTTNLIGEVITLDAVNKGYLREMNITKNFASNGTETPASIMPAFSEGNTGLVFHIGHGSGDGMSFDYGSISYNDVMSLSAKDKYPVVVSIACMNGGYDAELITGGGFSNCLAEGLLRSQAGGIAYYGGVRVNYGAPDVSFKNTGEWIVGDQPEMAKMLTYVFQAYSEGNNTLGGIAKEAFNHFIETMNPDHNIDWVTAFEFVFLGDPVFSLLPQGSSSDDYPIMASNPSPNIPGGGSEAKYYFTPTYNADVNFTAETNSSEINQTLYKFSGTSPQLVNSNTLNSSPFAFGHAVDSEDLFMLCYETSDFKETRTYFSGEQVTNLPPSTSELTIENQNQGSYALTWTESIDLDGSVASYTIAEYINPTVVLDECDDVNKWDNMNFSVSSDQNNGHSAPNCLSSGSDNNYNASITSLSPVLIQEGDSLKFNVKYNIEEGWDYAYVEISEDGVSYVNIDTYTGQLNSWTSKAYDLSDYVGKSLYFKFRYVTDGLYSYDGLFVDDIYPVSFYETTNLIEDVTTLEYQFEDKESGAYFYKVKSIDDSGNGSLWSNMVNVEVNIGVEDLGNQVNVVSIYPNPVKDIVKITCAENSQITVYDILGVEVEKLSASKGLNTIDMSDLPLGTYFIKAAGEFGLVTRKIILNK